MKIGGFWRCWVLGGVNKERISVVELLDKKVCGCVIEGREREEGLGEEVRVR